MGRIDRKYMAHMIDLSFNGNNADVSETTWVRLGQDLEEYGVALNPETEVVKNILGEQTFRHNGYEASSDASPFYAYTDDPLFKHLQTICDERLKDDALKTACLEVHLWESADSDAGKVFVAYKQDCYVVPQSYGGDTSGYQIPFQVFYSGSRVKGKYTIGTEEHGAGGSFTADT